MGRFVLSASCFGPRRRELQRPSAATAAVKIRSDAGFAVNVLVKDDLLGARRDETSTFRV